MSPCAFLLDECVPAPLLDALSRPGVELDVAHVGDAEMPKRGAADSELLFFCEAHKRILITVDRKSLPVHIAAHFAGGQHTYGVLLIAPNKAWRQIYDEIVLIAACSGAEEWIDRTVFLPQLTA